MPLLASRSLWEQSGSHDVIVDIIGVSSNHGVGAVTIDGADVIPPVQEEHGSVGIIWPSRGRRPKPRISGPAPLPDVTVRVDGIDSNRGVGRVGIDVDVYTPRRIGATTGTGNVVIDVTAELLIQRRRFVPVVSIDLDVQCIATMTRRGVGAVTVETPFDITDDEMMVLMSLLAA